MQQTRIKQQVRQRRPKKRPNTNGRSLISYERIPAFRPAIHTKHKFRYQANELAANLVITDQSLLTSAGVIVRTNGAPGVVNLIYCALKVKSVEIWTPASAAGTFVSLKWSGVGGASQTVPIEISDTTLSTSAMGHVKSKPPPNSLAKFWRYVNGNLTLPTGQLTLFTVFAPALSIMDVEMELIQNDNDGVLADNITVLTTTVGTVVYLTADDFSTTGTFDAVSVSIPAFMENRPLAKRGPDGKITREFRDYQESKLHRKDRAPTSSVSLEERLARLERRKSL